MKSKNTLEVYLMIKIAKKVTELNKTKPFVQNIKQFIIIKVLRYLKTLDTAEKHVAAIAF